MREAKERLAKKLGVPIESVQNIDVSALDKFRFDTALADRNPFYKLLVDETNAVLIDAEQKFLDMEGERLKQTPITSEFLAFYGRETRSEYEFFELVRNDELVHRNRSARSAEYL